MTDNERIAAETDEIEFNAAYEKHCREARNEFDKREAELEKKHEQG